MDKKDIPENWELKKLKDIGKIYSGGTPDRDNEDYFGGDIPWLRLKDIDSFFVSNSRENLTEEGLANSSAQLLPEGTVIVSTRATIGEVAVAEEELTTNQGFKSIYPKKSDSDYVAYYLSSITHELENMGRTTTYPEVNKTQFSNIEVPLPPLAEQRAIANKLDSLFEKIDEACEAQEEAEKIQGEILGSFTQSIIPRENPPDEWELKELQELGDIYSGGTPQRDNEEYFGGDIPWLRLKDAKSFYVEKAEENITEKGLNESSAQLIPEGSVIVSTRATIGEVTVSKREVATNQGFKSVHPEDAVPEFIAYQLLTMSEELERLGRTTTYPEVNKTQFSEIELLLPPLSKQREIVERLDSVEDRVDEIRKASVQMSEILENLPKAILNKAFRGELVEYEAEESDEGNKGRDPSGGGGKVTLDDF